MKIVIFAIIVVGLLGGCSRTARTDKLDPHDWNIESFNNADSVTDPNNVYTFPSCDLIIGFVGRNVQPFEGKQKDANGWMTNMWSVGSTLALRSWRDEHTPWRQEEFIIISVTKSAL